MKHICRLCKFEVRKKDPMGLCVDCKYHLTTPVQNYDLEKTQKDITSDAYKQSASLVELSCDALVGNREQVAHMATKIAEGDIHWICLLKAWYRSKNKKIPANVNTSSNPKQKIIHLLKI